MVNNADTAMELLDIIQELVEERCREEVGSNPRVQLNQISVSRKEILERSKWSLWHVVEYLEELVERGYVVKRTGSNGRRFMYCVVEQNAFSAQSI